MQRSKPVNEAELSYDARGLAYRLTGTECFSALTTLKVTVVRIVGLHVYKEYI